MRTIMNRSLLVGWLTGFGSASLVAILLFATASRLLAAVNPNTQMIQPPTLQGLQDQITTLKSSVSNLQGQVNKLQGQWSVVTDLRKSFCNHVHVYVVLRSYQFVATSGPTETPAYGPIDQPPNASALPGACLER